MDCRHTTAIAAKLPPHCCPSDATLPPIAAPISGDLTPTAANYRQLPPALHHSGMKWGPLMEE